MPNKEKHLDFILSAVARMAQNSFLARGWSITLTTALLAVASNIEIDVAYALAVVPILIFWIVDAYYLALERRYRLLFDEVRVRPDAEIDYSMDLIQFSGRQTTFKAMFTPLILFIYGSMASVVVILSIAREVNNATN